METPHLLFLPQYFWPPPPPIICHSHCPPTTIPNTLPLPPCTVTHSGISPTYPPPIPIIIPIPSSLTIASQWTNEWSGGPHYLVVNVVFIIYIVPASYWSLTHHLVASYVPYHIIIAILDILLILNHPPSSTFASDSTQPSFLSFSLSASLKKSPYLG